MYAFNSLNASRLNDSNLTLDAVKQLWPMRSRRAKDGFSLTVYLNMSDFESNTVSSAVDAFDGNIWMWIASPWDDFQFGETSLESYNLLPCQTGLEKFNRS